MAEEFRIIIKKNGEVWVDLGNMEPQRLRSYRELFEETIGPIKSEIASTGGGTPGAVGLTDLGKDEDSDKEREKIKGSG